MTKTNHIERFAPSPTGLLHLGHAFSALTAFDAAQNAGGEFLLRIEDIDFNRSKPDFETQIYDDLRWLGLSWPEPVLRQSDRRAAYDAAMQILWDDNHLFSCTCSRKDIAIAAAPQEGGDPLVGPDGIIYPGTCRNNDRPTTMPETALRLSLDNITKTDFTFTDLIHGTVNFTLSDVQNTIGNVMIARKDIGISYHLAVVLDDAYQGITHVTRGVDLFEATKIHVVLQHILGLPTPIYRHHRLIRDENGKRLAKRDDARSIQSYRANGMSPTNFACLFQRRNNLDL
jgi:glutamyl-Q tRNA(Asp) synthetase